MESFETINALAFCYLTDIRGGPRRSLELTVTEASAAEFDDDIEGVTASMALTAPDAELPRAFRIRFAQYVAYSVRNESFASNAGDEVFEGRIARVYERSRFLEFVRATTLDHPTYPGPYKHYGLLCVEHVVDVASTRQPEVTLLG